MNLRKWIMWIPSLRFVSPLFRRQRRAVSWVNDHGGMLPCIDGISFNRIKIISQFPFNICDIIHIF